jgi:ketosteroid isomerase-like protein
MSETRIERLRAGYEALNRGTPEDEVALLDPDFELLQASSIIDTAGHFKGIGAVPASMGELEEVFEDLRLEPEELIEAPTGEILVLVHATGRGRGSGISIDNRIAHVWTFRDDRATRLVVYEERADALEALGLAE